MGEITNDGVEPESLADIYQRIMDSILAAIEAGAGRWHMLWHSGADGNVAGCRST